MKLKDIEVGKEYANNYGQKVTVLEVGLYGRVYHDRVGSFQSSNKHYVKVERTYGLRGAPFQETLHYSAIAHVWETQEKIDKAGKEIKDGKRAEVNRLWDILEKYVPGINRDLYQDTSIVLNRIEITKVCEAFEALTK
jgi:hypothetical protein